MEGKTKMKKHILTRKLSLKNYDKSLLFWVSFGRIIGKLQKINAWALVKKSIQLSFLLKAIILIAWF